MNGSRGLRTLAIVVLAFANSPTPNHGAPPKANVPPAKTDLATKTIAGRVFDANGRPLAGAMVWLTREDDSDFDLDEPTVIAETQSRTDGRFELMPLVADLRKHADDPIAEFEVWVWRRGFAVGHWSFYGEPIPPPISIFLTDEAPFVLQLKTPKGVPCQGASVTPTIANFDYSRAIPKPLQDQLKVKSAADGHVDIHGFNGQLKGVSIEKPEFGTRTLLLSERASPPLVATLHNTRSLEGRFIFPKGERVDSSQATLRIEVASERMTPCKNQPKDGVNSPLFGFWQEFSATVDRDGRFWVSGVLEHGTARFRAKGFLDIPFLFAPPPPSKSPKPVPQSGIVKLEIPLIRGIWCNVLIRDAQTKKPLPNVDFTIGPKRFVDGDIDCDEEFALPDSDCTDSQGRIRIRVRPGETYRASCAPCEGYLKWAANNSEIRIPAGVDRFDLPPIELTRACAIRGRLVDAGGKPLAGIRVRGTWSADALCGKHRSSKPVHWATTDSVGLFRFEDIAAGTNATLLPARAGVPIGDPVKTTAGDGKPVELRAWKEELVALSGRVLGLDHKPVSHAQILVEIGNLPDTPAFFPVQTGADGTFLTPCRFPKRLKYRLTVRSLLDAVESSDWMSPAVSGTSFPDLSVDVGKLRIGTRLSGDEVVARVNGEPIRARELLERAFVEPLTQGRTLFTASKELVAGETTEREFRALQDEAINKYAAEFARTRLLAKAFLAMLDAEQRKAVEEAVDKEFAGYVEKELKGDFRVSTAAEVDRGLQEQGTTLASLRAEFRYRLFAQEYVRSDASDTDDLATKALEYYKAHGDCYVTPEKVGWQLIEANFYKPRFKSVSTGTTQTDKESGYSNRDRDLELTLVSNQSPFTAAGQRDSSATSPKHSSAATPKDSLLNSSALNAAPNPESAHESDEYVGRDKALETLNRALEQLRKGEPFETAAKKFSDGPGAEQGGWQKLARPDSIADAKTAAALRELAEGATSSIIETDHSVRIVRLVSRIAASHKPFEEVSESIQKRIRRDLRKKEFDDLVARALIELPSAPPPDWPTWDENEGSP